MVSDMVGVGWCWREGWELVGVGERGGSWLVLERGVGVGKRSQGSLWYW